MLQSCLNGNRSMEEHPGVPRSPAELAHAAVAARQAGAAELHIHPRDAAGGETLDPVFVAAALDAIRDAVPGMTDDDPSRALAEYRAVMEVLTAGGLEAPVLLHGEGGSVWTMVNEAARCGYSTRVGLEDGLHLPDGTVAPNNAALVSIADAVLANR